MSEKLKPNTELKTEQKITTVATLTEIRNPITKDDILSMAIVEVLPKDFTSEEVGILETALSY